MTPFCVAITGGIGSGKSTAASFFKELNVEVISADKISKALTTTLPIKNKLKSMFGYQIFDEDFNLKRKILADIIFNDAKKKQHLENLLHPLIRQQIISDIAKSTKPYCLIEIPLLKNIDNYPYINRVLCIKSKPENQLKFAALRDKTSHKKVKIIIANQITDNERLAISNDIIENNETLNDLKEKCSKLHYLYIKLASHND